LQEVGEILHLANSGRAVVKLFGNAREGQILCDEKGQKVAKITELIGPVREPYASTIPLTNNTKKSIGKTVFAMTSSPSPARRKRKFRRTKR